MSSTSADLEDILSGNEGDEGSETENEGDEIELDEETDADIQQKLRILRLLQEHKQVRQNAEVMNVKAPTLKKFIQAGQATVERENERKRQIEYAQAQMHTMDQIQRNAAMRAFNAREGLDQAIREQIFPCVVSLITNNGVLGTGFFQHSSWLVSNAHLLPSEAGVLETEMLDHNHSPHQISFEQSYHRPADDILAPDIVIINTKSRASDNNKCLQTKFFTDDPVYKKRVYFYVYDDTETNIRTIRYIEPYDTEHLPLKFKPIDDFIPPEGCSGSPVLEGRITISPNPEWQFRVIGTAYARCSASLAVGTAQSATVAIHTTSGQQQKLLCVIPVDADFNQILEILNKKSTAEHRKRFRDTAAQCNIAISRDFTAEAKEYSEQASALADKYKEGITPLNIQLPPGLEKLWYKYIVKLSQSLLIPKVLQEIITNADQYPVPALSFKAVQSQFKAFINFISTQEKVDLVDKDDIFKDQRKERGEVEATRVGIFNFRLDITEETQNARWKIDIQDNMLDASGNPLKYQGKSLSSVFSRVYLPLTDTSSGKRLSSITGRVLGQFLLDSQMGSLRCNASDLDSDETDKAAVIYINSPQPSNAVENSKYKIIYASYPFEQLNLGGETKSRAETEYLASGSTQTLYKEINLYDFCPEHVTLQKLIQLLQSTRGNKEETDSISKDLQVCCKTYFKEHQAYKAFIQLRKDCVDYGKSLIKEHYPDEVLPVPVNDNIVYFLEKKQPPGYDLFLAKKKAYALAARTFFESDVVFDKYVESLRTNLPGLDTILLIAKKAGFTCQIWKSHDPGFIYADKIIPPQGEPLGLEINIFALSDDNFKILENKGPYKPNHISTAFSLPDIYCQASANKKQGKLKA